jgi:iron uptake system component EfeO
MRTILNLLIEDDEHPLTRAAEFESLLGEPAMLKCLISLFRQDLFAFLAPLAIAGMVAVPATAASLDDGVKRYAITGMEQIDAALAGAEKLQERVAAKDIEGAKQAWIAARTGWERSETFTGSLFPDLDAAIDSWPDATTGFHAIEAKIFTGDLNGVAPMTDALIKNLQSFSNQIHAKGLTAQGLLDGSAKLAFEIGENKSSGGESAVSGTSLDDMRHNADGLSGTYKAVFEPTLATADPKLEEATDAEITRLGEILKTPDLKSLDVDELKKVSERLAISFQTAAAKLGLEKPNLED